MTDGAATATFDVPGSVGGKPLQGTVRVDATWGTTTEDAKITVTGSELTPSVSDVLPNESITISGNGYGTQSCINVADITLDNVALQVDSESTIRCTTGTGESATTFDAVEVSNSGQFVATITMWPRGSVRLEQSDAVLTVLISWSVDGQPGLHVGCEHPDRFQEPTVSVVTPNIVGPRDYIVHHRRLTGRSTTRPTPSANSGLIGDQGRRQPPQGPSLTVVYADNTGRFTIEHRVSQGGSHPIYQPSQGLLRRRRDRGQGRRLRRYRRRL